MTKEKVATAIATNTGIKDLNGNFHQVNVITFDDCNQGLDYDFLEKFNSNKFALLKKQNDLISPPFLSIDKDKARRLNDCHKFLVLGKSSDNSKYKIVRASSCRVRYCPICAYKRSVKYCRENKQMIKIFKERNKDTKFIFLTLTIKNCFGDELKSTIDLLSEAFHRFIKLKQIKSRFVGFIKNLEVTYNKKTRTFHPHLHVYIAVNDKLSNISQQEYCDLWQKACRLNYIPICDVRICTDNDKSIVEVSKYLTKFSDICKLDYQSRTYVLSVLNASMANRRTISFGGIFKDIRKEMNYEDDISDKFSEIPDCDEKIIVVWHFGLKIYKPLKWLD